MQINDKEWADRVVTGAAALGVALTPEQLAALSTHAEQLLLWNQKVNLTAITDVAEVAEKHVVDALAVIPHLPDGGRVLDMGTGGGFPGIAIAILRPDLTVVLVDAVRKKVSFVSQVIRLLGLGNACAVHSRVESLSEDILQDGFDAVVSRAFTALDNFAGLAFPVLKPSGEILALKGAMAKDEAAVLATVSSLTGWDGRRIAGGDLVVRTLPYALPFGGGDRHLVTLRLP